MRKTWPILLLVLLLALFLGPVLFTGRIMLPADLIYIDDVWRPFTPANWLDAHNPLISDQIMQYYPWRAFAGQATQQWGEIPLWNPYCFAGAPYLANAQSAPLYPINWLGYLIPAGHFYAWAGLLRFFFAGLFTYLFLRSLGAGKPAALLAGFAYMLSGPMVVWLSHPNTDVFLWLPGALWAVHRAFRSRRPLGWLALLAVLTGIMGLAGHFQSYFHALLVVVAYAVFMVATHSSIGLPPDGASPPKVFGSFAHPLRLRALKVDRSSMRIAGGIVLALVAGIALSAPQTLPFAEFLSRSGTLDAGGRTSVGPMDGWLYSPKLWPNLAVAITQLVPDFLGNPITHDYYWPFWIFQNYNEQATYIGTLPLILALAALGRPWRKEKLFFLGLAVFCFGVAFRLPIFEAINHLPVFSLILNKRLRFVLALALAVLAGLGADALFAAARGRIQTAARLAAIVTAILALGLGGLYLLASAQRHGLVALPWSPLALYWLDRVFRWTRWRTYLPLLAGLAATVLLYLALARRISPRALVVGALLVTGGELFLQGYHYYPMLPSSQLFPSTPAIDYLRRQPQPLRIVATGNAFLPNWAMAAGIQEIGGFDLPVSRRIANLYTRLGGQESIHHQRWSPTWPLLELWGVQYAIGAPELPPERYELVYDGELRIYRLRDAMPRVFSVERVQTVPGEAEALDRLFAADFDYRRTALVEAAPGALPATGYTPAEALAITRYEANRVTVQARFAGQGFLVLGDAYDPGWRVSVDGQAARLFPADYLLRGVAVPVGEHTIEFVYAPEAYAVGVVVALLVLVGLGAVLIIALEQYTQHRAACL